MRWEDDRMRLLAEVRRLQALAAKHERTVGAVRREVDQFRQLLAGERGGADGAAADIRTGPVPAAAVQQGPSAGKSRRGGRKTDPPAAGVRLKAAGQCVPLQRREGGQGGIKRTLAELYPPPLCQSASVPPAQFVDVVRNKDQRAALPGHSCVECEKYIAVLRAQGLLRSEEEVQEMLRNCSRHKSAAGRPPDTPDGFWDLTVHTPEDWKR